jgi:hypothetical protein
MIVLDSNVISEVMRPQPNPDVLRWLDEQPNSSVWTTSVNIYEIRSGLESMPHGSKQSLLMHSFGRWLSDVIQGRIASFDESAARRSAELHALRKELGRPVDVRDTMIAGIVLATHATLATRNVKHFDDIAASVVNPWEA